MAILAFTNPTYQPAMRIIQNITQANPAVITTTFDHNYQDGDIVRIDIARGGGMVQINQQKGTVTVLSPTTFSLPIDSTTYDTFVFPTDVLIDPPLTASGKKYFTPSQVVPVGNINSNIYLASKNVLRVPRSS